MEKKLYYYIHAESDSIFISEEDGNIELDCIGEVKERTLSELKLAAGSDCWILKSFTDQQLIQSLALHEEDRIYIYTDGSCNNKTHLAGGCGIVLKYKENEKHIALGQYINTTSARMEIRATLEALKLITNKDLPIKLYCDNKYVTDTISLNWAEKWESENWLMRKNSDLWKQVLEEVRKFKHKPEFIWVKGHNNHHYNELCDRLAAEGGKKEIKIDDSEKQ